MKIEEKFEDVLYGEMYGLIYFFIEEMSGSRGEEEIRKVCRKIYKNRKEIGLFTKQDISKGNAYDEDGNIVEIEIS